jgi:hypothetical protein
MEQRIGSRTCPKCGSGDYVFRGRKKIPADVEKGQQAATDTRYCCRACGHEWKERVAGLEWGGR